MNKNVLLMVDVVSNEKGVEKEIIFQAMEAALASATKKRYSNDEMDVRVVKPRHNSLAVGIDHLGRITAPAVDFCSAPNCDNAIANDRECFRSGQTLVSRPDFRVGQNEIGRGTVLSPAEPRRKCNEDGESCYPCNHRTQPK